MIALLQILRRSSKTSTLKFALARALVELVEKSRDQREFDAQEVAERLLQYYWYQVGKFHLKQAPHEIQTTTVEAIVEELGSGYNKFDEVPLGRRVEATNRMLERGFKEVRRRFHNLKRGRRTSIKFFVWKNRKVTIPDDAYHFLSAQPDVLKSLICHYWTIELEKWNNSPRIASKVLYDPRSTRKRIPHRKPLIAAQTTCFYCDGSLGSQPPIDHVIPRSFVFEDEVWNLVATCSSCNATKSDQLPDEIFISKLVRRNTEALQHAHPLSEPMRESLLAVPGLHGQNDPNALHEAITRILQNARTQGFTGAWTPITSQTGVMDRTNPEALLPSHAKSVSQASPSRTSDPA
jgi:5-methylcytosine-specific restriction endonuclease McrA